jgi:hypothetical protein
MTIEEKKIVPAKNVFRHPGPELLFMLQGGMTTAFITLSRETAYFSTA